MRFKVHLIFALLLMAVWGAWADSQTHVVTQSTVDNIFSGTGYTLGSAVNAGDVLDFQGTIDLQHSLVVNKQVTIMSSTKNAVIKLNTVAGSLIGDDPGNSFVINKAGSGTAVHDIRLENTETWLYNTSNVTFTGVTMWVKDARVGTGVGHVSIRYSDHVTFDSCTVYTENNGGSAAMALTGSSNCTFQKTTFEGLGSVGAILYLGNVYNVDDKPTDFVMVNNHNTVKNCTLKSPGGTSSFNVGGTNLLIEGNTITCNFTAPYGNTTPTNADEANIYRNNTITGSLNVFQYSLAENNTVTGNVTVQANATATDNQIFGTVTANQKNATITGNTVVSTGAYAISLSSRDADANNTVQNNVLMADGKGGDDAVNSRSTGNTISGNKAEGTCGTSGVTWSYAPATQQLIIGGTGAMPDYRLAADGQHSTAPWAFFDNRPVSVSIGGGVTAIGANAFYGMANVDLVFVNSTTVPTLGSNAFAGNAEGRKFYVLGNVDGYKAAWTAHADDIAAYIPCGPEGHETDVLALYDDETHTLTITGTGAMADYASAADQPWSSLQGELQTVVVDKNVTAVGNNAFANCRSLSAVYIDAPSLTAYSSNAFEDNAEGRKIYVPVSNIGSYTTAWTAYAADIRSTGSCGAADQDGDVVYEYNPNTKSLTISGTGAMADFSTSPSNPVPWNAVRGEIASATIQPGVTSIGNYAFYYCSTLGVITIPSSVTSIGNYAFYRCLALLAVTIPEGVTSIGDYAFSGCSGLTAITIPDSVTSIGNSVFSGCSGLTAITIPDSVTSIGGSAFYGCSGLTAVTIPEGVTSIDNYAFHGCSGITAITIPDGVTSIGHSAFNGCSGLTAVTIPEGVTSIGNYAFYGCSGITAITIPDSVTTIGSSAFANCTTMISVTLPGSVSSVGGSAFVNCNALATVKIMAHSLATYGTRAFDNNAEGRKIYVRADAVDTYKAGWPAYANDIEAMQVYSVALADGTDDAANWTITPSNDLEGGETVTITYTGNRIIRGIRAVQKAAAEEEAVSLATPLTMECLTDGTIKVDMGSGTLSSGMQYAVNGGAKTTITTTTTIEDLTTGDKVQFYGVGTSTTDYGNNVEVNIAGGTATVKVYGNIMSLLDEENFATKTDLPNSQYVFYGLFYENAKLTDASGLLLPATTLAGYCYTSMFNGCTALTAAPELPATKLTERCYSGMFYGCKALTAAPALPATTLASNCYYYMFYNCSKLTSVTCKATNISARNCLNSWLYNAGTEATSPTLYVDPSMTSNTGWNKGNFTVTAIPGN